MIYVEFSDSTETSITAIFGSAQDPEYYPYQGIVENSDPRYAVFWNILPDSVKVWWPTPE